MTKTKNKARRAPPAAYDDNPPLTAARLRMMRPAAQVVPEIVSAAKKLGRPKLPHAKVPVSLRLPPDILLIYQQTGKGWQGRMSEALAKGAAKLRQKV